MSAQQNRFDSLRALAHQHIASRHVYPDEDSLYRQTHDRAESAYIAAATPTTILALLDALDAALTPATSDEGDMIWTWTKGCCDGALTHALGCVTPRPDDRDREVEQIAKVLAHPGVLSVAEDDPDADALVVAAALYDAGLRASGGAEG